MLQERDERKTHCQEIRQSTGTCSGRTQMWELSDRDFKIAVIKCMNDVLGKVDNIH